jgi:hypothetical protein
MFNQLPSNNEDEIKENSGNIVDLPSHLKPRKKGKKPSQQLYEDVRC